MSLENCFEINRYELKVSVNDKQITSIVSNDEDEINTSYERIFNKLQVNNDSNEIKDIVRISIFDYDKNTVIKEYGTDEI
jgi:hypothetical protein